MPSCPGDLCQAWRTMPGKRRKQSLPGPGHKSWPAQIRERTDIPHAPHLRQAEPSPWALSALFLGRGVRPCPHSWPRCCQTRGRVSASSEGAWHEERKGKPTSSQRLGSEATAANCASAMGPQMPSLLCSTPSPAPRHTWNKTHAPDLIMMTSPQWSSPCLPGPSLPPHQPLPAPGRCQLNPASGTLHLLCPHLKAHSCRP